MPEFRRPPHRRVAGLLRRLDPGFMRRAECYFGGGTQLVMQYGEYRVSEDIDLLCSSRAGWRMLRETVTQRSLGRLFARPVQLEREVRADRDAIRTFLRDDAGPIKLEIIVEGAPPPPPPPPSPRRPARPRAPPRGGGGGALARRASQGARRLRGRGVARARRGAAAPGRGPRLLSALHRRPRGERRSDAQAWPQDDSRAAKDSRRSTRE